MKGIQVGRRSRRSVQPYWTCARLPAAHCRSDRATTCLRVPFAHPALQHANPDKEPPCSLLPR
jgi:hypothetical protein